MDKYYKYSHNTKTINTIQDFVFQLNSLVSSWSIVGFMKYDGETGVTNLERVYNSYNPSEKEQYKIKFENDKIFIDSLSQQEADNITDINSISLTLLKTNTELLIPFDRLNNEILATESTQIFSISTKAFLGDGLEKIKKDIQNNSYKQVYKNEFQQDLPQITVWMWCKALAEKQQDKYDLHGDIINLTPFISNLDTSVSKDGGNWNISLPPLSCYYDNGWKLKNVNITNEKTFEYHSSEQIYENSNNKRSELFFKNIIGENDIIFIRFEALEKEIITNKNNTKNDDKTNNRLETTKDFIISKDKLPNNIYDMIGLVDGTSINTTSNDININISGRDLKKLLTDDGCYFTPLDFIGTDGQGMFANEIEEQYIDRIDGKWMNLMSKSDKSINFAIKLIVNALGKIKISEDNLFDAYGRSGKGTKEEPLDTRSKFFKLDIDSRKRINEKRRQIDDYEKQTREQIKLSREKDSLSDSNLEIGNAFSELKKFIGIADVYKALLPDLSPIQWKSFKYLNENIKNNLFTSKLFFKLFRPITYYINPLKPHTKISQLEYETAYANCMKNLKQIDKFVQQQMKSVTDGSLDPLQKVANESRAVQDAADTAEKELEKQATIQVNAYTSGGLSRGIQ